MNLTTLQPLTITVAHEEEAMPRRSPLLTWSQHGESVVTRYLRCSWADLDAMLDQILGRTYQAGTGFTYQPGAQYDAAGGTFMAYEVAIEGEGQSSGIDIGSGNKSISWDKALVVVRYQGIPAGGARELLLKERLEPGVEFVTVPNRKLYWDNATPPVDPLGPDERPGRLIYTAEWTYQIRRIPFVPSIYFSYIGQTNDAVMTSPTYNETFAVETILYNPPEITERLAFDGHWEYDLTMHLSYRSTGWNKAHKSGTAAPVVIYDSAGNEFKQYPPASLGDLLLVNV